MRPEHGALAVGGWAQRSWIFALIVACAVTVWAFSPDAALARSYAVDRVEIDAVVAPDGSLTITEDRTMSFDGSFRAVDWRLSRTGADDIEIMEARLDGSPLQPTDDPAAYDAMPEGRYLVQDRGDVTEVSLFHRTTDAARTFTIVYRVDGAADRWSDTSELYWQLLGGEWEVPTGAFRATVRFPGVDSAEQVRAWAHGPLTGEVDITDEGDVTLTVDDVPARTFVEVRALFPTEALSEAPVIDEPREQQVLEEEAELAERANRQRLAARAAVGLWAGVPSVLGLLGVAMAVWAFVRYGREHKAEFQGQYFREDPRPDLHPAVIGALWRFGKVEDSDIAASLMELADRGVIRMTPRTVEKGGIAGAFGRTEQTFVLERVPADEQAGGSELDPLDSQLMALLFDRVGGGSNSIELTQLESYAKANAQTFSAAVKAWKDSAAGRAEALGFFEPASKSWQVGTFVAAAFVLVVAVFGVVQIESFWPLVVAVPSAILMGVLGVFMNRRSKEGNELFARYTAVRDFLKDFSRLHEAPPQSVVLWNRFLVLAVIFGIAEEVIEQLRVRLPDVVADRGFQTSYWWVYAGAYGRSPVSTISQSFVSASQEAASKMSSASGGGGGFSGGGGFGGGGGGGGAR